jgi:hypothetical protein
LFYIYGVDDSARGGHRHKTTVQALICLKGSCKVYSNDNHHKNVFSLDKPSQCLLLDPADWHILFDFEPDTILLVVASKNYDEEDYIFERYQNDNFLA